MSTCSSKVHKVEYVTRLNKCFGIFILCNVNTKIINVANTRDCPLDNVGCAACYSLALTWIVYVLECHLKCVTL